MWTLVQRGIGSSTHSPKKKESNRFHSSHFNGPDATILMLSGSPELISVNRSNLKMFNLVNGVRVHADLIWYHWTGSVLRLQ